MLKDLKQKVIEANQELPKRDLVTYTWGNASAIDRDKGLVVIKPSGVPYENLNEDNLAVVDLNGNKIEGDLKPSSDTETHLTLYRKMPEIGGVVHTHSPWATSWAQAGKAIIPLGTTHADHFYGQIPCSRELTQKEIENNYEKNTGRVIVETLEGKDSTALPGIIVNKHGPFSWGADVEKAVYNAVVMEEVAKMAYRTINLTPEIESIDQTLLDKHFLRKHGQDAYYGQG